MTSCDRIKQLLSSFLENTIDPDSRSLVESHLSKCPECKSVLSQVEFLTQRLSSVSNINTSSTFDQKLRAQIVNQPANEKRINSIRTWSYGFSGAVILATVTFFMITDFSGQQSPELDLPTRSTISSTPKIDAVNKPSEASPVNESNQQAAAIDSTNANPTDIDQSRINLIEQ